MHFCQRNRHLRQNRSNKDPTSCTKNFRWPFFHTDLYLHALCKHNCQDVLLNIVLDYKPSGEPWAIHREYATLPLPDEDIFHTRATAVRLLQAFPEAKWMLPELVNVLLAATSEATWLKFLVYRGKPYLNQAIVEIQTHKVADVFYKELLSTVVYFGRNDLRSVLLPVLLSCHRSYYLRLCDTLIYELKEQELSSETFNLIVRRLAIYIGDFKLRYGADEDNTEFFADFLSIVAPRLRDEHQMLVMLKLAKRTYIESEVLFKLLKPIILKIMASASPAERKLRAVLVLSLKDKAAEDKTVDILKTVHWPLPLLVRLLDHGQFFVVGVRLLSVVHPIPCDELYEFIWHKIGGDNVLIDSGRNNQLASGKPKGDVGFQLFGTGLVSRVDITSFMIPNMISWPTSTTVTKLTYEFSSMVTVDEELEELLKSDPTSEPVARETAANGSESDIVHFMLLFDILAPFLDERAIPLLSMALHKFGHAATIHATSEKRRKFLTKSILGLKSIESHVARRIIEREVEALVKDLWSIAGEGGKYLFLELGLLGLDSATEALGKKIQLMAENPDFHASPSGNPWEPWETSCRIKYFGNALLAFSICGREKTIDILSQILRDSRVHAIARRCAATGLLGLLYSKSASQTARQKILRLEREICASAVDLIKESRSWDDRPTTTCYYSYSGIGFDMCTHELSDVSRVHAFSNKWCGWGCPLLEMEILRIGQNITISSDYLISCDS